MSSLEHTQHEMTEKAEHSPSSSEGVVHVNWNWQDEILVDVVRFTLTHSRSVTLAVVHLPVENCFSQPLVIDEEDKQLEVLQFTSQRFLKGDGVIQISLNWPNALIAKILRVNLSRAKGATVSVLHTPTSCEASLSPWEAGYIAFLTDLSRSANPHIHSVEDAYWWNQGWELAQIEP